MSSDDLTQTRRGDGARRARLLVHWDGGFVSRELPESGSITFGRSHSADVRIDDASVSRLHATLHVGQAFSIEDLGSSNGTRVAGRVIEAGKRVPLRPNDKIEVGAAALIIDLPSPGQREAHIERGGLRLGGAADLIARAAPTPLPVLLVGETGVGKEVAAQAIVAASPRASAAFVRLNCAALSEALLESELFGHERGAFTGAEAAKPGLLEAAHGGTLFLDEIGELGLGAQAKLLRVIEIGEVTRVGAVVPRTIDVRFVLATNRDLQQRIAAGAFRQDLFYRINGVTIVIPPLRARVSEIVPLAELFSLEAARRIGRPAVPLAAETTAMLEAYGWPGNVRELRHVIERAVLMFQPSNVLPEHLPPELF
jgi:two-component system response regulator AtoC